MHIEYQDLSAFIEHVVDKAWVAGFQLRTINDLYGFLDDNPTDGILIIDRNKS